MKITYSNLPNIAKREGWIISNNEIGLQVIQRFDEQSPFKNDDEATLYVAKRALTFSPYHRSTIEYILQENPDESLKILKLLLKL